MTSGNSALTLNIAANYGGRWDIINAAKTMMRQVTANEISIDDIDEQRFEEALSTDGLPELDLLIRTGGDHRVSNFLLWQCAYAEFYFTETLWPDFSEELKRDAMHPLPGSRNEVSVRGVSRYVDTLSKGV